MLMKRFWAVAAVFCLFWSPASWAEVHIVTIGNNFFSPNDLNIKAGDTVRWVNNSTHRHDVTADDFSWSSPQATSFEYERTFNTVGEVLYHCTLHSVAGRNIANFMNGRLTVDEGDPGPNFLINAGISDAWYDPTTAGQGFFIIVWEDSQAMFLSWFTYDTERPPQNVTALLGDPGHRWLTAQGDYAGDTAALDVYLSDGGTFDSATPVVGNPTKIGTIDITWTGCNAAMLSYDLPAQGLSGNIPIERIVLDNVATCEAGQPAPQ